ncbi:MAG: S-layer homology domain-containing protein, partial [Tumebacillaceae bacterium]
MNKKITNIMLATLVMTMTMAPAAAKATVTESKNTNAFVDLGKLSQAKQDAIREAKDKGLLSGDANGQFHPENRLTRQELAVLLANALHLTPLINGTSSFSDLNSKDWGSSYIEAVRRAGLMSGNEKGEFRPNDPITREELAVVFVRAVNGVGARGGDNVTLKDQQAVSSWANGAVDTAVRLHLIDTVQDTLNPKGNLKREDIAPLLLDIFQTQKRSAVITKVDGDFVTINGKQYLIEGKLKDLIGDRNKDALQGAVLNYTSTNATLGDIGELEIVQSGAVLDLGSTVIQGSLKVAADGVTVKGQSVGQLVVEKGVTQMQVDAPVKNLLVGTDQALKLTGSGSIDVLKVDNPNAKVSLDKGMAVDQVQLPDGVKLSDVLPNVDPTQIKNVQGGIDDRPSPVVPTPTPTPTPVNHAPEVSHTIDAVTAGVEGGTKTVSLTDVFHDRDGDKLTYSVKSSDSDVATVAVDGTNVVITPVAAGTATITVTAKDSHKATVDATFTLTVTPPPAVNHAPTVDNGLSAVTTGAADGTKTVSLVGAFADADGDALTYSAESSATGVATVTTNGSDLVITPVNAGTATIKVIATDSHGDHDSTTMQVTIHAAATKSLFFSEVVYGHDYLQGFEIYNPTGETIN